MGGCYSVAPEHGPRIAAVGGGTGLSTLRISPGGG